MLRGPVLQAFSVEAVSAGSLLGIITHVDIQQVIPEHLPCAQLYGSTVSQLRWLYQPRVGLDSDSMAWSAPPCTSLPLLAL